MKHFNRRIKQISEKNNITLDKIIKKKFCKRCYYPMKKNKIIENSGGKKFKLSRCVKCKKTQRKIFID